MNLRKKKAAGEASGAKEKKNVFKSQQFKSGAYSSFLTVIVIALVVVVNLVFGKLDLSTDLSSGSLYTLSKETKNVVKKTRDKITIYYMVEKGSEESHIQRVLKQYNKISDQVKVKTKDPIVYPGFAKKYVSDDISNNDVIVVNETTGAAKYISNGDMYYSSSDYYSSGSGDEYLDVEGRVTSAIQYVTSENNTKMYQVTGHNEVELGDSLKTSIEKMNVELEDLSLATKGKVPSDCDILLINGPATDLLDKEKEAVLNYLKAGGNAIILTQYTGEKTPNLDEVLDYYGVTVKQGNICESAGNYINYVNWIVPSINYNADMMSGLGDSQYIMMPNTEALVAQNSSKLRSSLTITDLLTTSKKSYLKVDTSSGTGEKESGDLDGPFSTGLYIEDKIDDDTTTKLVVYSSAGALSEQYTSTSQLANASLLENAVSGISGTSAQESSIDVKNLSYSTVSMGVGAQVFWSVLLVLIIPVALLVVGFGIWFVRRRK